MAKVEKLNITLDSVLGALASEGAAEFRSLWKKTVSADERVHSHAVSFKDGRLTVAVDNSIYLQNFILNRKKIMDRINEISPEKKVIEINFKHGSLG